MAIQTNTYTASADVTIKSVHFTKVNFLQIGQQFEGHHTFEISVSPSMLPDPNIKLQALADKLVGEPITIELKQGRHNIINQSMTFNGIVINVRLVKDQKQSNTFLISGSSPTIVLNASRTTQCFIDKTLSVIVDEVLNPFSSLQKKNTPSFAEKILYITQYEEDHFHFLQRLAERYGEWMYYDGSQLIFGKSSRPPTRAVELIDGVNLFEMDYGVCVTPLNFAAVYYNYETHSFSMQKSKDATVDGLQAIANIGYDKSEKLFSDNLYELSFHESEAALKQAVKLKKSEQSNKLAVLKGRTPEMEIKLGGLIKVKDEVYSATNATQGATLQDTTPYGTFVVTRLSHSLDSRGVYQATFEAVPNDASFAPVDYRIVAPIAHPQMAYVRQVDDDQQMGRVKVHFTWHAKGELTPWIPVSSAMSGSERGVYFMPEVDELVLVDFEFGDPDLPFVTGSIFNKKPGPLFNKDNNIKGIITKGGNHIIIDDTDGKENIKIYNKGNKNEIALSLDGDTTINIKSEGSINLEAKDKITMKAKTIEFTADQEWKVKAGKTEIKNDQGMEITANTELKIQSTSVKVKGDANVEIEANGAATFKAKTVVDIESSGMTILKGMPVLIN